MSPAKPCGYNNITVILHCGLIRMWEEKYSPGGRENCDRMTRLNFGLLPGSWLKILYCGFVETSSSCETNYSFREYSPF